MLVQKYLSEGTIDSKCLDNFDWGKNLIDLGFILSFSGSLKLDLKVLENIYTNQSLDPAIRLVSIIKQLGFLETELQSQQLSQESEAIYRQVFAVICSLIIDLKSSIGILREILSKVLSQVFSLLYHRPSSKAEIFRLVRQGHLLKDLIVDSLTFMLLSLEDLETLETPEKNQNNVLKALDNLLSILSANKVKKDDPISKLANNACIEILNSGLNESQAKSVEAVLNKYENEGDRFGDLLKNSSLKKDEEQKNEEGKRRTVADMFSDLYYSIEEKIQYGSKINSVDLENTLKKIALVSELFLFEEIEYYSRIEKWEKTKSLLWKLIFKGVSSLNLFNAEKRAVINRNIDKIVAKCRRGHR